MLRFRTAALVALLGTLTAATNPAVAQNAMGSMDMAHARYSQAPVFTGSPTLPLTLSIVVAGGGPGSFDSAKLVGVLAGPLTDAEVKKLSGTFTPEYCEDCGAPLFANADGEIVHAELPEEADTHVAHFH